MGVIDKIEIGGPNEPVTDNSPKTPHPTVAKVTEPVYKIIEKDNIWKEDVEIKTAIIKQIMADLKLNKADLDRVWNNLDKI